MKYFFSTISYIFHPVFLALYMLTIMLVVNPYSFDVSDDKSRGILLISVGALTILFPLIAVGLMRGLNLIKDIHLRDQKDRISPLAATGLFYMWLYINIRSNTGIDPMFSSYILGAVIAIFLALLMNAFTKVSLHTMGVVGMVVAFFLYRFNHSYDTFLIHGSHYSTVMRVDLILLVLIMISGLVATSRLYLKEHTPEEALGGAFLGVVSQLVAYRFLV